MGSVIVTIVELVIWLALVGEIVVVCSALLVLVVTNDVEMVVVWPALLGELVVVCSVLVM